MGIVDTAKSVVGLAQEVNRMDLYKQAVDLMAQVTEQQQDIMRLHDETAQLRERIRLRDAFQFVSNAYWLGDPRSAADANTLDQMGPYCTRCFDVLDRPVRMHKTTYTGPIYVCPECGKANATLPGGRVGAVPQP
jgi:hypothetical protein